MEENNGSATKEKRKQKSDRRRSSKEDGEASAPSQVAVDNTKDEIKKFKENLLQSVSSGEQVITESAEDVFGGETHDTSRVRERSSSRPSAAMRDGARGNVLADLDEGKLYELKEAFLLFDLNGDGCIDHSDLRGTLVSLGERVDDQAVRNMLAEATNPLDFDAFVTLLGYKTLELDTEDTLVAALSRWDRDNSGLISEERIRHDLMTWGDKFTEKEADYALAEAPVVQKGGSIMIDYIKFCSELCGLRRNPKKGEIST